MTQTAIRIEGLTRDLGSVRAVDGLSLEMPGGTIFGFLGPNGAGKTRTIRLLLGLLEPSAGRAEVLGYDTRTQAQKIRTHTGALLGRPCRWLFPARGEPVAQRKKPLHKNKRQRRIQSCSKELLSAC